MIPPIRRAVYRSRLSLEIVTYITTGIHIPLAFHWRTLTAKLPADSTFAHSSEEKTFVFTTFDPAFVSLKYVDDDDYRLPLVATGLINAGPVR
jgi:hypothetical protein